MLLLLVVVESDGGAVAAFISFLGINYSLHTDLPYFKFVTPNFKCFINYSHRIES
jgi:hypothetical protein